MTVILKDKKLKKLHNWHMATTNLNPQMPHFDVVRGVVTPTRRVQAWTKSKKMCHPIWPVDSEILEEDGS